MSNRPAQIALITAGTLLAGAAGYAVYFDYMRRNSPEFRKGLKKQQKKIAAAAEARSNIEKEKNSKLLRASLASLSDENPSSSPEEQEAYFQEHVAEGEVLAAKGPEYYVESATHFYRALRVYPQPVELLMIYQKVVPAPVFALLIELTSLTGGATGGAGGGVPAPTASVADIDDGLSSPTGRSLGSGSGGEWENVGA